MPVAIDGERLGMLEVIETLNDVVGAYGWGRIDMVENRRVGIKSRETYECPAGLALILAHKDLESICLERDLDREKARHRAPLRRAHLRRPVVPPAQAGLRLVRRLEPGVRHRRGAPAPRARAAASVTGRRSPHSLYDYGLATYDAADRFRHEDSAGFVRLWGLGIETWAARQGTDAAAA